MLIKMSLFLKYSLFFKSFVIIHNIFLENNFPDIKDFKTRKNSKGEIKEIVIKFNY